MPAEYFAVHYQKNRERIRARQTEYRKRRRDAILAQKREFYDANRVSILEKQRTYVANPRKVAARLHVNHSVRRGEIPHVKTLRCVDCGAPAREYDHYLGYDEAHWLEVQPVCTSCHGLRSSARGEYKKVA